MVVEGVYNSTDNFREILFSRTPILGHDNRASIKEGIDLIAGNQYSALINAC